MAVMLKVRETPGRGCKCCPDLKTKKEMRRKVRRTEKLAWKREI